MANGPPKNKIGTMYYLINNKKFYNVFAAFSYAAYNCPNEHVYFNMYDEEFSKHDWTIYPDISYENLFAIRARQIRNKFNKVGVAFSGGTDSVAVLKAFLNNKIKVDFVYIGYMKTAGDTFLNSFYKPQVYIDWIKSNWPEESKSINFIVKDISDFTRQINHYSSEEYVFDETQTKNLKFSPPLYDEHLKEEIETYYKTSSWKLVTGNEIPHVSGNHSYYVDKTFAYIFNKPYLEFFFLSPDFPEIAIKQSHDLKKYNNLKIDNYYIKKSMVGCDSDLHKQSESEKRIMLSYTQNVIEKIDFKSMAVLEDFLKNENMPYYNFFKSDQNRKYIRNWFSGYAMLNTDKTLINYMVNHGYLDNEFQPVQSYHGIRSNLRSLV